MESPKGAGGKPSESETKGARAMADMKKDFQKVIKAIRDSLPKATQYYSTGEIRKVTSPEYPKAMMTAQTYTAKKTR